MNARHCAVLVGPSTRAPDRQFGLPENSRRKIAFVQGGILPVDVHVRDPFVARQRRLRVGTEWYRVDLVLVYRRLRALIIVDLKLGKFTHADAGQMNLYVNYAREHWTNPDESPPIG